MTKASFNSVHQSLGAVDMIHRRLRARREASTSDANCGGSMIGLPRHGDMLVRSASAETMRNAPVAAARSRIRLFSPSARSPTVCGGSVIPPPDASAISAKHLKVLIDLFIGVFTTVAGARPVRRNS